MRLTDIPEISQMTTSEKILLLEDLWDEIAEEESNISVPRSHKNELDSRLKDYESNPGELLSLSELQARINHRK